MYYSICIYSIRPEIRSFNVPESTSLLTTQQPNCPCGLHANHTHPYQPWPQQCNTNVPTPANFDGTPTECIDYTPIMWPNHANLLPSVSNQLIHIMSDDSTPTLGVNPIIDTMFTGISPTAIP